MVALFPQSRALLRQDASKSAIKELGNGFSILHFAMHGKFDADLITLSACETGLDKLENLGLSSHDKREVPRLDE